MGLIQNLVHDAIATGYLSCEDENHLRHLLQATKYGRDDIQAFVRLQQAIMVQDVRQQSRLLPVKSVSL
ncbi:hypothetical protein PN441_08780 [Spirulina major CS-329]|jgi:hypothetical protein|uniref:hypothetical protein n=1 Tax=Spirulina TaxID=1154 RepID=UPI000934BE22|nr:MULTISPECIES: hypothetical protein [Spirulina]MDB9494281.1 hypothetical protein [Spirulina subsalsa CS-330]MDB9503165.1 hypothetical protein [Spirulina major CS-329]